MSPPRRISFPGVLFGNEEVPFCAARWGFLLLLKWRAYWKVCRRGGFLVFFINNDRSPTETFGDDEGRTYSPNPRG